MTSRSEPLDERALLDLARRCLAACSDGLDTSAVQPDTPLAAVIFDSLMAVKFIATLEASLGLTDLPFERWLDEHSERTEALTIGSLIEWLRSFPEVGACDAPDARRARNRRPSEHG